ncbi:MAG TPA: hypothetical protein VNF68_07300 [Candidatus Baltobacteraceae bacterium]|nr:hypothetical protein [Candidatus Baltobacteraceae bacterium]
MSDPLATGREARYAKKLLLFGTDHPVCARCRMSDIRCLCRIEPSAKRGLPTARCHNCHRKRRRVSPKALLRKLNRFSDAGYTEPTCVVCRESDLRLLELDHLAGAANSAFLAPLCGNCHAIKSDAAEDEPMASLRLRDPNRSALVLQAAFEFGLALVLSLFAAASHEDPNEAAQVVFFGLAAAALVAWAIWNLSADDYFTRELGSGYDKAIAAEVPR